MGFKTSKFEHIIVLDKAVVAGKKLFPTAPSPLQKIDTLDIERQEFSDLRAIYQIKFPTQDLYTLTVSDGTKSLTYQGIGAIALRSDTFTSFDPNKSVSVKVTVQKTSTPFTHDTYTSPVTVFEKTMILAPGYKTDKKENIQISQQDGSVFIHGIVPA